MITIQHASATFKIKPENAQATYDLLAIIDKSKGKRGAKFKKEKSSETRSYPVLYFGLTTAEYVSRYANANSHLNLSSVNYEHADRRAPLLDPTVPEVVEEKNN